MFSDPIVLKVAGVNTHTLPRTGVGPSSAVYTKDNDLIKTTISHQNGKRNRRLVKLDVKKVAADPLSTSVNKEYSCSIQFIIDEPTYGFDNTEMLVNAKLLTEWLTESSGANITKVLGGES
jgi:hypothetical protein